MTVSRQWDLQQAVYARLTAALASAGRDGAGVPVYDHVRVEAPLLFVRIDGFSVDEVGAKACDQSRHRFTVHVFHRPEGQSAHAVGSKETKRIQSLIYEALHRWRPFAGGHAVYHQSSSVDPDQDGLTRHGISRFSVQIGA